MKKINNPLPITVKKDGVYFWCACGKSANQPLCDGSHNNTKLSPVKVESPDTFKLVNVAAVPTKLVVFNLVIVPTPVMLI